MTPSGNKHGGKEAKSRDTPREQPLPTVSISLLVKLTDGDNTELVSTVKEALGSRQTNITSPLNVTFGWEDPNMSSLEIVRAAEQGQSELFSLV